MHSVGTNVINLFCIRDVPSWSSPRFTCLFPMLSSQVAVQCVPSVLLNVECHVMKVAADI